MSYQTLLVYSLLLRIGFVIGKVNIKILTLNTNYEKSRDRIESYVNGQQKKTEHKQIRFHVI